jgi:hypothetical protein
MRTVLIASAVCLAVAGADATVNTSPKARLAAAARVVLNVQPTIPAGYWDKARCVVVFPELRDTDFVVGGKSGKGVIDVPDGRSLGRAGVYRDGTWQADLPGGRRSIGRRASGNERERLADADAAEVTLARMCRWPLGRSTTKRTSILNTPRRGRPEPTHLRKGCT